MRAKPGHSDVEFDGPRLGSKATRAGRKLGTLGGAEADGVSVSRPSNEARASRAFASAPQAPVTPMLESAPCASLN